MVKYLFRALYEDEKENGIIARATTLGLGIVLTFLDDKGAKIDFSNWRKETNFQISYCCRELELSVGNSNKLSVYSLVPLEHVKNGQALGIEKFQWDAVYRAFRKKDLDSSAIEILSDFVFHMEYKFYKLILHKISHGIRFRSIFDESDSDDD